MDMTYEARLEAIDREYYEATAMHAGMTLMLLVFAAWALWSLPWRRVEQEQLAEAWTNGRHIPIPPRASIREMVRAWSR
jgi:hypothetical protein